MDNEKETKAAVAKTVTEAEIALIGAMGKIFMKFLEMADSNIPNVNTDQARLAVLNLTMRLTQKDSETK